MDDSARDDFHGAVVRHFDFLFAAHGYAIVAAMNERGGEYQMQIAASERCQIKFALEQDSFDVRFARLDAPREWSDEPDGVLRWHSFWALMAFEDETHPGLASPPPASPPASPPPGDPSLDDMMQGYAKLVEHYLPRFESAFAPDPPAGWWTGYRAFRVREYKTAVPLA